MSEILDGIKATAGPDLLVGFDTSDDAAVYRLSEDQAVVSTADFITPVVDDPVTFGRIAAANSISDVYAMGGTPLMAINLMGYPPVGLPNHVLGQILAGGAEICLQAGCPVAGGHTVRDDEVKFGLSVTGTVHPDRILRNSTARPGDVLVLTKPLGTGALVAARKKDRVDAAGYEALIACMTTLNSVGPLLHGLGATACTDVTGFGLSGHALEMARGAEVTLEISTGLLPQLPRAVELCGEGFTCGGTRSNASFTAHLMEFAPGVGEDMAGLVHDPQTSGGLLVAVPEEMADDLAAAALENGCLTAARVGRVVEKSADAPYLRFLA